MAFSTILVSSINMRVMIVLIEIRLFANLSASFRIIENFFSWPTYLLKTYILPKHYQYHPTSHHRPLQLLNSWKFLILIIGGRLSLLTEQMSPLDTTETVGSVVKGDFINWPMKNINQGTGKLKQAWVKNRKTIWIKKENVIERSKHCNNFIQE